MPGPFDKCVAGGGKVRTKTINENEYMHICILKGKTYAGEVKKKKKPKKKGKK